MSNLLEQLLSTPVRRKDNTVLALPKRLPPTMPRELLDTVGQLGRNALAQNLKASVDFGVADRTTLTYAALGRWPTSEELKQIAESGGARGGPSWPHTVKLLTSREFRLSLARLALTAFPEKQRLLLVEVPGYTPPLVATGLASQHCVVPADLMGCQNVDAVVGELGRAFSRLNGTRTLAVKLPSVHPFVLTLPARRNPQADPLNWADMPAPFRPMDLLFTVMRPPAEAVIHGISERVGAWRDGSAAPPEGTAVPARDDEAGWQSLARAQLHGALPANPLCQALGDGTEEGALAMLRRFPVTLVHIRMLDDWMRSALGADPYDLPPERPVLLPESALSAEDRARIAKLTAEDAKLHARFAALCDPSQRATILSTAL